MRRNKNDHIKYPLKIYLQTYFIERLTYIRKEIYLKKGQSEY
jgi:hypothetical protein